MGVDSELSNEEESGLLQGEVNELINVGVGQVINHSSFNMQSIAANMLGMPIGSTVGMEIGKGITSGINASIQAHTQYKSDKKSLSASYSKQGMFGANNNGNAQSNASASVSTGYGQGNTTETSKVVQEDNNSRSDYSYTDFQGQEKNYFDESLQNLRNITGISQGSLRLLSTIPSFSENWANDFFDGIVNPVGWVGASFKSIEKSAGRLVPKFNEMSALFSDYAQQSWEAAGEIDDKLSIFGSTPGNVKEWKGFMNDFANYSSVAARQGLFSKTANLTEKVVSKVGLGLDVGVGVYAVAKAVPGTKLKIAMEKATEFLFDGFVDFGVISGVSILDLPTVGVSTLILVPSLVAADASANILADKVSGIIYNNAVKLYKNNFV